MKLILVRHGETQEGKKGIILGSLGGTITAQGKKEAKEIVQELTTKKLIPNVIISSPLKRAKNTACIISRALKINVLYEPLIRERSAGISEGKNEKNINWELYEKKPLTTRKHKGGESFSQVYVRAEKFLRKLHKKYNNETILVISHSAFILMLLALIKHKTIEQILQNNPKDRIIVLQVK